MADSNGKPAAENEDDVSHIFFSIILLFIEIISNCALISFDPKIAFLLIGLKLINVEKNFVFTTAI